MNVLDVNFCHYILLLNSPNSKSCWFISQHEGDYIKSE